MYNSKIMNGEDSLFRIILEYTFLPQILHLLYIESIITKKLTQEII